jgi:hypothetical protein
MESNMYFKRKKIVFSRTRSVGNETEEECVRIQPSNPWNTGFTVFAFLTL